MNNVSGCLELEIAYFKLPGRYERKKMKRKLEVVESKKKNCNDKK